MSDGQRLKRQLDRQIERIRKARRERSSLLAQTAYIGTLGLVMVAPIVGGAYLGHWLDSLLPGYSMRWTLSLLCLGIAVGAFNVYFLIRNQ